MLSTKDLKAVEKHFIGIQKHTLERGGTEHCTLEDIIKAWQETSVCPYCKEPFDENKAGKKRSIDRIHGDETNDPYKYADGTINFQVAHGKCNTTNGWKMALARYTHHYKVWSKRLAVLQKSINEYPGDASLHPLELRIVDIEQSIRREAALIGINMDTMRCRVCGLRKPLNNFKPDESTRPRLLPLDNVIYPMNLTTMCLPCEANLVGLHLPIQCKICKGEFNTQIVPWQEFFRCEERETYNDWPSNPLYPKYSPEDETYCHIKCCDNPDWLQVNRQIAKSAVMKREWMALWKTATMEAKEVTGYLPVVLAEIEFNYNRQTWSASHVMEQTVLLDLVAHYAQEFPQTVRLIKAKINGRDNDNCKDKDKDKDERKGKSKVKCETMKIFMRYHKDMAKKDVKEDVARDPFTVTLEMGNTVIQPIQSQFDRKAADEKRKRCELQCENVPGQTLVVNCHRDFQEDRKARIFVYIGDQSGELHASIWRNPFHIKFASGKQAEEAIRKYEHYVRNTPRLMSRLHELKGRRLACWCWPEPCHGDVLVKLIDEFYPSTSPFKRQKLV
jgi:hypothetical protein